MKFFAAFLQPILLVVSFVVAAWLFLQYFLDYLTIGLSIWAVAALYLTRLPKDWRHMQWLLPLAAIVWGIAFMVAMVWLRDRYLHLLTNYSHLADWLYQAVRYPMPDDVGKAVLPLSALFLCLFVFVKSLYLTGIRLAIARQRPPRGHWGLAYYQLPAQGWTLRASWLYARWLARAVAAIGLAAFVASWLSHLRIVGTDWLPLLAAALLLVGIESAAWLGGPVGQIWRPHLEGEDSTAERHGQYTAIWQSYRKVWRGKWLAAGNLAPHMSGGPGKHQART